MSLLNVLPLALARRGHFERFEIWSPLHRFGRRTRSAAEGQIKNFIFPYLGSRTSNCQTRGESCARGRGACLPHRFQRHAEGVDLPAEPALRATDTLLGSRLPSSPHQRAFFAFGLGRVLSSADRNAVIHSGGRQDPRRCQARRRIRHRSKGARLRLHCTAMAYVKSCRWSGGS